MTPDGKSCVDRNECLDNPCKNGGVCHNRDTVNSEVPYVCRCMDGYMGSREKLKDIMYKNSSVIHIYYINKCY